MSTARARSHGDIEWAEPPDKPNRQRRPPRKSREIDLAYQLGYTPTQAALVLNKSKTTIYELLSSGQLAAKQFGASKYIPRAALLEFIERLPDA